jgi:hypothetical protein
MGRMRPAHHGALSGITLVWLVLGIVAWDGGDRLLPQSLFGPAWVVLLLFPPLLGALVVSLARQGKATSSAA